MLGSDVGLEELPLNSALSHRRPEHGVPFLRSGVKVPPEHEESSILMSLQPARAWKHWQQPSTGSLIEPLQDGGFLGKNVESSSTMTRFLIPHTYLAGSSFHHQLSQRLQAILWALIVVVLEDHTYIAVHRRRQ